MSVAPEIRPGRPGGLRLILLRFLAMVLLLGAAGVAARQAMGSSAGTDPRVAAAGMDATAGMVAGMMRGGMSGFAAVAVAGGVLFFLFDQLLTATALLLLDGRRGTDGPVAVWRVVWDEAPRYLPRFLRLSLFVLIAAAGGVALFGQLGERFAGLAIREGWMLDKRLAVMTAAPAALNLLWLAMVGAGARWARALTVADDRIKARRTVLLTLRVLWRRWFRTGLYFVLPPLVLQLAGGVYVGFVATQLKRPLTELALMAAVWLLFLLLQCGVWYLLLHRARVMLAHDQLDDIRAAPDQALLRSLLSGRGRRKPKKRKKRAAPPPKPSTDAELDLELEPPDDL